MENTIAVSPEKLRRKYRRKRHAESWIAFGMVLPSFLGLCLFVLYPIVWIFRFCLFSYNGFTEAKFIGLENFIRLFARTPEFWQSVVNTFIIAVGKLAIELPLALILAYILDKNIKGRNIFRIVYFLPTMISIAIIGIIFYFLFSSYNGVVNGLLQAIGIINSPLDWFNTRWKGLFLIGLASVWQNFGLNMVFFLTGLQSIPKELYECADLDGINGAQKLFYITIPLLGPMSQIIVMNALLGSLKIMDGAYVLTRGGPAGTTRVMMSYIYGYFFNTTGGGAVQQYGFAAAATVIVSIILSAVGLIYLKMTSKSTDVY